MNRLVVAFHKCVGPWRCPYFSTVHEFRTLEPGAEGLLQTAIDQLGFSARAYDKVLRVARTLADLEEADTIETPHVAEAIQYRSLDRQLF